MTGHGMIFVVSLWLPAVELGGRSVRQDIGGCEGRWDGRILHHNEEV
jgi:hypothetical protein